METIFKEPAMGEKNVLGNIGKWFRDRKASKDADYEPAIDSQGLITPEDEIIENSAEQQNEQAKATARQQHHGQHHQAHKNGPYIKANGAQRGADCIHSGLPWEDARLNGIRMSASRYFAYSLASRPAVPL